MNRIQTNMHNLLNRFKLATVPLTTMIHNGGDNGGGGGGGGGGSSNGGGGGSNDDTEILSSSSSSFYSSAPLRPKHFRLKKYTLLVLMFIDLFYGVYYTALSFNERDEQFERHLEHHGATTTTTATIIKRTTTTTTQTPIPAILALTTPMTATTTPHQSSIFPHFETTANGTRDEYDDDDVYEGMTLAEFKKIQLIALFITLAIVIPIQCILIWGVYRQNLCFSLTHLVFCVLEVFFHILYFIFLTPETVILDELYTFVWPLLVMIISGAYTFDLFRIRRWAKSMKPQRMRELKDAEDEADQNSSVGGGGGLRGMGVSTTTMLHGRDNDSFANHIYNEIELAREAATSGGGDGGSNSSHHISNSEGRDNPLVIVG